MKKQMIIDRNVLKGLIIFFQNIEDQESACCLLKIYYKYYGFEKILNQLKEIK